MEHDGFHIYQICNKNNPFIRFKNRSVQLFNQLSFSEISGSLGDLGTLIPLLLTLSKTRTVLLSPALFFAGLSNVFTGYAWDVPMCVQPMKSIAAVAIADQLTRLEVTTAGIWIGLIMTFIGVSNLIELVKRIVPENVVSGIQVGVGIKLAGKGLQMVEQLGWLGKEKENMDDSEINADSILLAVTCSFLVLYWLHVNNVNISQDPIRQKEKSTQKHGNGCFRRSSNNEDKPFQHPVGIYLFLLGILFASITLITTGNTNDQYDLPLRFFGAPVAVWALEGATWEDWKVGLLEGAIPQLPLTTLNSVISVCALAHSLYPSSNCNNTNLQTIAIQKKIPSRREVSVSVGLINLLFCPFGSMPNCHGAGGLAAQHRLGARHGASVVFLGVGKIILSVFFGASALTLLDALPNAILGVMLVIAGVELCITGMIFLFNYSTKLTEQKKAQYEEEYQTNTHTNTNTNANTSDVQIETELYGRDANHQDEESQPQSRLQANAPSMSTSTSVSTCSSISDNQKLSASPDWDLIKKESLRSNALVTIITASVIISLGKTHYGALSGWITHLIYNNGWSDLHQSFRKQKDSKPEKERHNYD